jgi:glucose-1-phosphate thymidylyltransferase
MKIIVPMAGMGKRMRPHTLTVPKPLIPVAGKPIVQRLVEDIADVCEEKIDEIAFIIAPHFGKQIEANLKKVAADLGAKGTICYQEEALGTAHAILCAKEALEGRVIVAFADTLFRANFTLDDSKAGIIWVQRVEDPRAFGVVTTNDKNEIVSFVEKPEEPVSDQAIIGIYYFKDGAQLKDELQYLIDNNIMDKGEYQITDALKNLQKKGVVFVPGEVDEWLDCGNYKATVHSNQRVLEFIKNKESMRGENIQLENAVILEPCLIGDNVKISNSIVGPHVTLSAGCSVEDSVLRNSIVYEDTTIKAQVIEGSMIGKSVQLLGTPKDISVGDFTTEA